MVHIVDDLCLAGDVQDFVEGEEDAKLLLVLTRVKLLQELFEDSIGIL